MMEKQGKIELKRNLSPVGAWALSFGCIIGWSAFVMPGSIFLPMAGPLGTAVAICIAIILMFVLAANYHYMVCRYPRTGGAFIYTHMMFGSDHSFVCAWLLGISYIALAGLSVTALARIERTLLGGLFQFGFLYNLAGYDIYLGEIMLAGGVLIALGALCICDVRCVSLIQTFLAALLIIGVFVVAVSTLQDSGSLLHNLSPAIMPDKNIVFQIFSIVSITPFAFAGFETMSQTTSEFWFPVKRSFQVTACSILMGGLVYILLNTITASAVPEGYDSWISNMNTSASNTTGFKSSPTFLAADRLLGERGLIVIGVAALTAILTGIIGFYVAASRLLYSLSIHRMLPGWFCRLNRRKAPKNALLFVMIITVSALFLGEEVVNWIADMSLIGSIVSYGYTSAAACKAAHAEGRKLIRITGLAGVILSIISGLLLLIPNPLSAFTLGKESYLFLAAWCTIGFLCYWRMLRRK